MDIVVLAFYSKTFYVYVNIQIPEIHLAPKIWTRDNLTRTVMYIDWGGRWAAFYLSPDYSRTCDTVQK